ncbi:MAG: HXXEE domain-containing protein, partial [Mycobacterium sp.]
ATGLPGNYPDRTFTGRRQRASHQVMISGPSPPNALGARNFGLGVERGPSDRYILNQLNSTWVNVIAAYPFYIVPILFLHVIWLGLAPTLFNLAELWIHGVVATAGAKSPYNPGLLSCLPWLVLSIWYIIEVTKNNLASGADWGIAVGYMVAFTVLALPVGTFVLLSDRDSRYPFDGEELSRFEKYTRLIRTTTPAVVGSPPLSYAAAKSGRGTAD